MNAAKQIIEVMPEKFTRQAVLEAAKFLGYSYSTANGVIDRMLYEDLVERIGIGVYRKLETEDEEVSQEQYEELAEYEDSEDWEYFEDE